MLSIASQMPPAIGALFQQTVGEVVFVQVAEDLNLMPRGVRVLLPTGKRGADHGPPAGWPFDVEWVHLLSSGVDQFPDWLFEGVTVTNSPGVSSIGIAEYAMAAIFAAAKRLPDLWIHDPAEWHPTMQEEVAGSVLGIVGFGDIGKALASRALAFGMDVQALRHSSSPFPVGVRAAGSLAELFATSDHVVLALPATPQTERMVNKAVLAGAKPGLHLVNIARGSLIDDDALLAALESGRIGRATLDVTQPEPLPAGHPFYGHPQIKLTPHTSWNSSGLTKRLAASFEANVHRFRNGEQLVHVVNGARNSSTRGA
jgi:phosphoglycerate dehydrogenase-like enzyme